MGTLLRVFTGQVLRNNRHAHAPGPAAFPFGVSPPVASEISLAMSSTHPRSRTISTSVRGVLGRTVMPTDERMFMINDAASCVEVQGGAGNPTVLLVGSSMLSWPDELCELLVAGGRRVIRYDVRDTGRSESYPPGEPGYSLADLVGDAVGVLDATATERAHVADMSTGGLIAQLLALDHPERVATLTLVGSRPNPPAR
jgi:pimeloyl-ACP methyl ester carboxylesterase